MQILIDRFRSRERRVPEFIIGGAMKSGTTSLHTLLAAHPDVYMPETEIPFFDVDDFCNHPNLHAAGPTAWVDQDFEDHFEDHLAWYTSFFEEASAGARVGKTATSYLPSRLAPERLAAFLPDVKLIFLLRDPVDRTYSHYWHAMRAGTATESFEAALRSGSNNLLRRSLYRPQLERYLDRFPRSSVRVLLFEEFVEDPQAGLNEVLEFLELDRTVDVDEHETHRHAARVPRSVALQLWLNRLFRHDTLRRQHGSLPRLPERKKGIDRLFKRPLFSLNLSRSRDYPPMNPETRDLLRRVLNRENRELDAMLGRDLSAWWPWYESADDAAEPGADP